MQSISKGERCLFRRVHLQSHAWLNDGSAIKGEVLEVDTDIDCSAVAYVQRMGGESRQERRAAVVVANGVEVAMGLICLTQCHVKQHRRV